MMFVVLPYIITHHMLSVPKLQPRNIQSSRKQEEIKVRNVQIKTVEHDR